MHLWRIGEHMAKTAALMTGTTWTSRMLAQPSLAILTSLSPKPWTRTSGKWDYPNGRLQIRCSAKDCRPKTAERVEDCSDRASHQHPGEVSSVELEVAGVKVQAMTVLDILLHPEPVDTACLTMPLQKATVVVPLLSVLTVLPAAYANSIISNFSLVNSGSVFLRNSRHGRIW